jgi:hypothetical protein
MWTWIAPNFYSNPPNKACTPYLLSHPPQAGALDAPSATLQGYYVRAGDLRVPCRKYAWHSLSGMMTHAVTRYKKLANTNVD